MLDDSEVFLFISDEDEVGDRITVRSDEELKAMLSYVSMPDVKMQSSLKYLLNIAIST